MRQVVIDGTELSVSRLGFGTASLHHLFTRRARRKVLTAAVDAGVTHFDTAPLYGNGLAEYELGKFLNGQRSHFSIATKVGLYTWGKSHATSVGVWGRKGLGKLSQRMTKPVVDWSVCRAEKSLDASLMRLKTDYVDLLLLHEPTLLVTQTDEFLRWLERERERGRVRYWGMAGVRDVLEPYLACAPLTPILQTKDSLRDREAEFILATGRALQFTYGYLSSEHRTGPKRSASQVLDAALRRNPSGCVLVSTRRPQRLIDMTCAAGERAW